MTPQGTTAVTGAGCTGDACTTREPWPLHHVKHRGVYVRLCTACVLKYHPSLFCSLCLDLLATSPPHTEIDATASGPPHTNPNRSILHCSSCHNVCHASCLPPSSSSSDFFLCPSCSSSTTVAAADTSSSASRCRTVDITYARSILCAARLSAQSMTRAALAARADAERKAKEAAAARKRAREMLERVAAVAKMEKEKREKGKVAKGGAVVGGREREKWMRFHEMLPNSVTLPLPAAKFEQDNDAKDTIACKPSAVMASSVSKGNPSS